MHLAGRRGPSPGTGRQRIVTLVSSVICFSVAVVPSQWARTNLEPSPAKTSKKSLQVSTWIVLAFRRSWALEEERLEAVEELADVHADGVEGDHDLLRLALLVELGDAQL